MEICVFLLSKTLNKSIFKNRCSVWIISPKEVVISKKVINCNSLSFKVWIDIQFSLFTQTNILVKVVDADGFNLTCEISNRTQLCHNWSSRSFVNGNDRIFVEFYVEKLFLHVYVTCFTLYTIKKVLEFSFRFWILVNTMLSTIQYILQPLSIWYYIIIHMFMKIKRISKNERFWYFLYDWPLMISQITSSVFPIYP